MKNGEYLLVKAPPDYRGVKYRGKYSYKHHIVWWENTGEILETNEIIHHKNHNKLDNRFSNLEKMSRSEHSSLHKIQPKLMTCVCLWCKCMFTKTARELKPRLKRNKGKIFCSRSCQVKDQRSKNEYC